MSCLSFLYSHSRGSSLFIGKSHPYFCDWYHYFGIFLFHFYLQLLTCSKHAAYVGMSFIEAFLNDGIDERRAMEQHPFIGLVIVLFGNLLPSVWISFPQLAILNLLNLKQKIKIQVVTLFTTIHCLHFNIYFHVDLSWWWWWYLNMNVIFVAHRW